MDTSFRAPRVWKALGKDEAEWNELIGIALRQLAASNNEAIHDFHGRHAEQKAPEQDRG